MDESDMEATEVDEAAAEDAMEERNKTEKLKVPQWKHEA